MYDDAALVRLGRDVIGFQSKIMGFCKFPMLAADFSMRHAQIPRQRPANLVGGQACTWRSKWYMGGGASWPTVVVRYGLRVGFYYLVWCLGTY